MLSKHYATEHLHQPYIFISVCVGVYTCMCMCMRTCVGQRTGLSAVWVLGIELTAALLSGVFIH